MYVEHDSVQFCSRTMQVIDDELIYYNAVMRRRTRKSTRLKTQDVDYLVRLHLCAAMAKAEEVVIPSMEVITSTTALTVLAAQPATSGRCARA